MLPSLPVHLAPRLVVTAALLAFAAACGPTDLGDNPTDTAQSALSLRMGVDYSFARPSISGIRAAGYTFAARYVSDTPAKNMSKSETTALRAAGVDVVSNWENDGHYEILDGYSSGVYAATKGQSLALAAGMPPGRPIYFSADWDAQPSDQTKVNSFFDGAASVIGRERVGAYGGYGLISRLFNAKKITFGWQTAAWSGGNWDGRAQVRQTHNAAACNGSCDIDEAHADDFGEWGVSSQPCKGVADGTYCGDTHGMFGDPNSLYTCAGEKQTLIQSCSACLDAAGGDFCLPSHRLPTSADVDGDRQADFCARSADGVSCWISSGSGFGASFAFAPLTDAAGYAAAKYGSTLQMADVNGDKKADLCARASDGIHCWLSHGTDATTEINGPQLSDAQGWGAPKYYSSIQFGDVDGDARADLCARGPNGIQCWLSNGAGFGTAITGPDWSDAKGWDRPEYGSTIQMADVNGDGKMDICGRAATGYLCFLSNGTGFPTQVTGPDLSDAQGWNFPEYYSTIQLADVNGDGKADVCARGYAGITCWLSNGSKFPQQIAGPKLDDPSGWNTPEYYTTIQMADVDGDNRADLCARAALGSNCYLSNGKGFPTTVKGPAFTDAAGWNKPEYYSTLQLGDINGDGKADFCGRGKNGVSCYLSTGSAFSATAIAGPALTDANHWNNPVYFQSLTLVGGMAHALTGGVDAGAIEDDGNDPPVYGAPPDDSDGGIPFPQSVVAKGCSATSGGSGANGAWVLAAVLAMTLLRRR